MLTSLGWSLPFQPKLELKALVSLCPSAQVSFLWSSKKNLHFDGLSNFWQFEKIIHFIADPSIDYGIQPMMLNLVEHYPWSVEQATALLKTNQLDSVFFITELIESYEDFYNLIDLLCKTQSVKYLISVTTLDLCAEEWSCAECVVYQHETFYVYRR